MREFFETAAGWALAIGFGMVVLALSAVYPVLGNLPADHPQVSLAAIAIGATAMFGMVLMFVGPLACLCAADLIAAYQRSKRRHTNASAL